MIEAKGKEQAVLQLYKTYGLEAFPSASLLPPSIETTQTKGRKSAKAKSALGVDRRDKEGNSWEKDSTKKRKTRDEQKKVVRRKNKVATEEIELANEEEKEEEEEKEMEAKVGEEKIETKRKRSGRRK